MRIAILADIHSNLRAFHAVLADLRDIAPDLILHCGDLLIEGDSLTIRRVPYDVEAEANELRRSGLPHADWLARILLAGKYVSPD